MAWHPAQPFPRLRCMRFWGPGCTPMQEGSRPASRQAPLPGDSPGAHPISPPRLDGDRFCLRSGCPSHCSRSLAPSPAIQGLDCCGQPRHLPQVFLLGRAGRLCALLRRCLGAPWFAIPGWKLSLPRERPSHSQAAGGCQLLQRAWSQAPAPCQSPSPNSCTVRNLRSLPVI